MSDLISRQKLIDLFLAEGMVTAAVYVERMPSAQPERKKGKWIFEPKDAIELMFLKPKCSKCSYESADGGNFCSNCGADMRGENNE